MKVLKMFARKTCLLLCCVWSAFAVAQMSSAKEDQKSDISVNVRLVNVFASVTDAHGAAVVDLKKDDFSVLEDGHPEKISVFEQQSGVPISIVMALDVSGSVRKEMRLELESARRFTASILRPEDGMALITFGENVNEVVPFTNSWKRIADGMHNMLSGAGTSLYDAIYLSSMRLRRRDGRKVLVIITDGGDTTSRVDYQEALRTAQSAEVMVYSIIIVPVGADAGRNLGGEHALIQMSEDTGGRHYYADSTANLDAAFDQISRELRTQYLLGYYPSRKQASTDFRTITVKITRASANTAPAVSETNARDQSGESKVSVPLAHHYVGPYKVRNRSGYYTSKTE
jgi:Ca-activated chloride channel family protein